MFPSTSSYQLIEMLNVYELYAFKLCNSTLKSIRGEHNSVFFLFLSRKNTNHLQTRCVASESCKVPAMTKALVKSFCKNTWCSINQFFDCQWGTDCWSRYYGFFYFSRILRRTEKQTLVPTNSWIIILLIYSVSNVFGGPSSTSQIELSESSFDNFFWGKIILRCA